MNYLNPLNIDSFHKLIFRLTVSLRKAALRMLRTFCAGASLGGIYLLKTGVLHPPGRGLLQAQEIQYMAPPLSDISGVTEGSSMRQRMEKFIVTLQVLFSC